MFIVKQNKMFDFFEVKDRSLSSSSSFLICPSLTSTPEPLVAQMVKNLPAIQETWFPFLDQEITWRRNWQPTPLFLNGEFHGQVAKSQPQLSN